MGERLQYRTELQTPPAARVHSWEVLGEVGCTGQHPGLAVSQRGLCRAVLLALFLGADDDHGARRVPCGIPAWEGR